MLFCLSFCSLPSFGLSKPVPNRSTSSVSGFGRSTSPHSAHGLSAATPLNRPLNRSATAGPLLDSRNNQREQRLQLTLDAGIRLSRSRITGREQRQQSVHFVERLTDFPSDSPPGQIASFRSSSVSSSRSRIAQFCHPFVSSSSGSQLRPRKRRQLVARRLDDNRIARLGRRRSAVGPIVRRPGNRSDDRSAARLRADVFSPTLVR